MNAGGMSERSCNYHYIGGVKSYRSVKYKRGREYMNLDEKQLAKLLATDLNRYFERLVLIYQDQLYAFVMHRVHDSQAAEEIVLIMR